MFPEYRDLISKLRQDNPHFSRMFDEHHQLDRQITQLELNPVNHLDQKIELLKRQKLRLKDALYQLLRTHQQQST